MGKGQKHRATARAAAGEPRRVPATGRPVNEPIDDLRAIVPTTVLEQLSAVDLAQAYNEGLRIRGQLIAAAEARLDLVLFLRERGVSWNGVGWFLGVTGESARQQYSEAIEDLMAGEE